MRILRSISKKKGPAPGTLLHIGKERQEPVSFERVVFDQTRCDFESPQTIEALAEIPDKNKVYWINVNGIHEPGLIEKIGSSLAMHPLAIEDILNTEQRPKIENYEDHVFAVFQMLSINEKTREIEAEQVSLLLGTNFLVSFQERKGDIFNPIRERLKLNGTRLRKSGADYLFYALLDAVIDHYFVILEKIGDYLEDMEEAIGASKHFHPVKSLHSFKRQLLILRKSIWPLREIVNSIQKGSLPHFKKSTFPYFRDLYDHTVQIIETVEAYKDMSASLIEMHMMIVGNRMNEVMKILTMIATIFIPLTFIAGVYGMNFKFMPELEWKAGYPIILSVMFALGLGMFIFFRIKKWF